MPDDTRCRRDSVPLKAPAAPRWTGWESPDESYRIRAYPIRYSGRCLLVRWLMTDWWLWRPCFRGLFTSSHGDVSEARELIVVPHAENSELALQIIERSKYPGCAITRA